jgi:hypothetical protein
MSQQSPSESPVLFVDVDGVISLFGFPSGGAPPGEFHWVDGVAHCIGHDCGPRLRRLATRFELVWATGWEEKANEYLPFLLDLPASDYPVLRFDRLAVWGTAHWKLGAIDVYSRGRPAAWIDDSFDDECRAWAAGRDEPTLLVHTASPTGITGGHVDELLAFAESVERG